MTPIKIGNDVLFPVLDSLKAAGDSINGIVDINATFDSGISAIDGFRVTISEAQKTMGTLTNIPSIYDNVKIAILVFFVITLVMSLLSVIGTLVILCFQKYNLRYLIYAACFLMVLVIAIGIILGLLFGILTPSIYYGC